MSAYPHRVKLSSLLTKTGAERKKCPQGYKKVEENQETYCELVDIAKARKGGPLIYKSKRSAKGKSKRSAKGKSAASPKRFAKKYGPKPTRPAPNPHTYVHPSKRSAKGKTASSPKKLNQTISFDEMADAISSNDVGKVKKFLTNGYDITKREYDDPENIMAIHLAAFANMKIFKLIVDASAKEGVLNEISYNGTVMHILAENYDVDDIGEKIKYAIMKGADHKIKDPQVSDLPIDRVSSDFPHIKALF